MIKTRSETGTNLPAWILKLTAESSVSGSDTRVTRILFDMVNGRYVLLSNSPRTTEDKDITFSHLTFAHGTQLNQPISVFCFLLD